MGTATGINADANRFPRSEVSSAREPLINS